MKDTIQILFLVLLGPALWLATTTCTNSPSDKDLKSDEYYILSDFGNVHKYDSHIHIKKPMDSLFANLAAGDNFHVITINVNSPSSPPIVEQQELALSMVESYPENVSYATTFSVENWGSPDWQDETLSYLKESFDNGAVGVKVWKNIGLSLKDENGEFVMIDDTRFDPVIDFIAENNVPLIGHLGEPKNTWLPLEEMTVGGDKIYFKENPQYHMYLHPEFPSYEEQIAARDRMLEKHPDSITIMEIPEMRRPL